MRRGRVGAGGDADLGHVGVVRRRDVRRARRREVERDLGLYPWNQTPITAVCEDTDGSLFVGTWGDGIFRLSASGGGVTHISEADGLNHSFILSLCVDREGNLWAGTDGGGLAMDFVVGSYLVSTTVSSNRAGQHGGGVFLKSPAGPPVVR